MRVWLGIGVRISSGQSGSAGGWDTVESADSGEGDERACHFGKSISMSEDHVKIERQEGAKEKKWVLAQSISLSQAVEKVIDSALHATT